MNRNPLNHRRPPTSSLKLLLVSVILIMGWSHTATAKEWDAEELDQEVMRISEQLRCPTCQGLSVKDSKAGFAVGMQQQIRDMLKEGKTEQDIKDHFVESYTEWILREPPKEGFNLLVWTLPGVGLLLALALLLVKSKNWARSKSQEVDQNQFELSEEDQAKLQKDLERFNNS